MNRIGSSLLSVLLAVIGFVFGSPVAADTFFYQDDFETDKAMSDSYAHSPFVAVVPDISLGGFLHYESGAMGRGLGFYQGYEPYGQASLRYHVLEQPMIAIGGSVSFLLMPNAEVYPTMGEYISVYGSANGTTWSLLGSGQSSGPLPQLVSAPILPDSPIQYLDLRGRGLIDDLQIDVSYVVPEPATLALLVLGGLSVMRRQRR